MVHNYTRHGHLLEVSSTKYLGITISDNLSWNKHIDLNNIANKAAKVLGVVNATSRLTHQTTAEQAYKSLVRPLVEYALAVWNP